MTDQPTVSLWLDLDRTLRVLDQIYGQALAELELIVIEWYILWALYEQDGQRPSDLAQAVGRPATSFTPVLDKLEAKGLIERRTNTSDRRSVRIQLTEAGAALRERVQAGANQLDTRLRASVTDEAWSTLVAFLLALQQPVSNE